MSIWVLDTDVVVALLDRADQHHKAAARLFQNRKADTEILMSAINYAETLVRPADNPDLLKSARAAIRALEIKIVDATAPIAVDAARLRKESISLADGFALATARAYSAGIASFDRRVQRAAKRANIDQIAT